MEVVARPVATLGVDPFRGRGVLEDASVELEDGREVVGTGVAVPRVSEYVDDQEVEVITIGAVGWRACGTNAMLVSPKPGRAPSRVPRPPGSAGADGRPHKTHVRKRGSGQINQTSKRGNEAFITRGPARVRNEWR